MAEEPQIDGGNRLQHIHASGAVAQTVVGFQRDAAVVIVNPKQIPVSGLKGHGHTEVADILLHKRPGPAVGLQIPPEQSLMDSGFVGGEPHKGSIHRQLEENRVHGFL